MWKIFCTNEALRSAMKPFGFGGTDLARCLQKFAAVHSLRHAMRDRLRAVECPTDIIDQIGGWSRKGVGESYGRGYQVEQLWRWMAKAVG